MQRSRGNSSFFTIPQNFSLEKAIGTHSRFRRDDYLRAAVGFIVGQHNEFLSVVGIFAGGNFDLCVVRSFHVVRRIDDGNDGRGDVDGQKAVCVGEGRTADVVLFRQKVTVRHGDRSASVVRFVTPCTPTPI